MSQVGEIVGVLVMLALLMRFDLILYVLYILYRKSKGR
jgi:hypothetical protein